MDNEVTSEPQANQEPTAQPNSPGPDAQENPDSPEDPSQAFTQPNEEGFFPDTKSANACSVRVALRVRPLIGKELVQNEHVCVQCNSEEHQVVMGKDRGFRFDRVFDMDAEQDEVYELCVKNLVLGCFEGYNATVLAYGQTGSGKTFTMGSG